MRRNEEFNKNSLFFLLFMSPIKDMLHLHMNMNTSTVHFDPIGPDRMEGRPVVKTNVFSFLSPTLGVYQM